MIAKDVITGMKLKENPTPYLSGESGKVRMVIFANHAVTKWWVD